MMLALLIAYESFDIWEQLRDLTALAQSKQRAKRTAPEPVNLE